MKHQRCFPWRVGNRTDSNGWFDDITIPLNAGLVSIIGQKGTGKIGACSRRRSEVEIIGIVALSIRNACGKGTYPRA